MYLYWLESESRYVHRQSDVPKGTSADRVDVPTDTAGLMGYLNDLVKRPKEIVLGDVHAASFEAPAQEETIVELPVEDVMFPDGKPFEEPKPKVCMSAGAVLSRIDSPGVPVDQVVETIGKSPMYALKRYAGAVAVRFQELANR